jgi:hypothetical protein
MQAPPQGLPVAQWAAPPDAGVSMLVTGLCFLIAGEAESTIAVGHLTKWPWASLQGFAAAPEANARAASAARTRLLRMVFPP